jgi:hypothetical protein
MDCPLAPGLRPALLVEWRRSGQRGGWQGRVILVGDSDHGPVVVEVWMPAEQLHPVTRGAEPDSDR